MSTETAPRPVVYPALKPAGEPEGFARGHAAGYAAGLRKAEAQAAAQRAEIEAERESAAREAARRLELGLAAVEAAARALHARTAPVLADADRQLSDAALAIAEAVIGLELADAETGAKAALARALTAPDREAVVEVRLNPADLALLPDAPDGLRLVPDPGLAPGDAVAAYPDGELDARIAASLARATAALTGVGE